MVVAIVRLAYSRSRGVGPSMKSRAPTRPLLSLRLFVARARPRSRFTGVPAPLTRMRVERSEIRLAPPTGRSPPRSRASFSLDPSGGLLTMPGNVRRVPPDVRGLPRGRPHRGVRPRPVAS